MEFEVGPAAADVRLVSFCVDVDGSTFERAHDVEGQFRRKDRDAVGVARDLDLGGDGQVEIAAGQPEAISLELYPQAGQHRERGSARRGTLSRTQRFDEHVALTSELHDFSLSPLLVLFSLFNQWK